MHGAKVPIKGHELLFHDEVPRLRLPVANGYNKYTDKMVPGYTGDVPHWKYKFGGTYTNIASECVDEFITSYEQNEENMADVVKLSTLFPKLRPIACDPRVKDHLNLWTDNYLKSVAPYSCQPGPTEPRKSGYTGFIPRKEVSELGLARGYGPVTHRCLKMFRHEVDAHEENNRTNLFVKNNKFNIEGPSRPVRLHVPGEELVDTRVYHMNGVQSPYTGHIPKMKYESEKDRMKCFKRLEAFMHQRDCYGEYLRTKYNNADRPPPYP